MSETPQCVFRVRYRITGPHVECTLYVARRPNQTFASCGSFTLRLEELPAFQEAFARAEFRESRELDLSALGFSVQS